MGPDFIDDIDCGSFFDQIDDLFVEFPADNESADNKDFPTTLWPDSLEVLPPESDPIFSGNHSGTPSELTADLSVPYEDIVQLEWLSNFVEDSFSGGGMTVDKSSFSCKKETSENQFQTSSPVSVLESSSSSSSSCSGAGAGNCKMAALSSTRRGPQRARSKRPRPATFNPRPGMLLLSQTSPVSDNPPPFPAPVASSESENFAESRPLTKKKKKVKLSPPFGPVAAETNQNQNQNQSVRKCMHCEITKTPQWRAGPTGPKTLCNACGVRYKSGRLFPEYRPAASPTFVPSIHSNSHKKVLEMRNTGCFVGDNKAPIFMAGKSVAPTTTNPPEELIPNNNPSLDFV